jgi:hypothetical protein
MNRRPGYGFPAGILLAWNTASAQQAADQTSLVTGVTNIGPGLAIVAIAAGLILTLILRPSIAAAARTLTETLGRRRIGRILRARSSNVLDNFILPGAYGGLTRIDHAILTSGGILCIQTRHYNGIVFGEPDDAQWSHVSGGQRRKFLNPQIQNEGRAAALRKVVPDVPVANLVVFTGHVQFTTTRDKNVVRLSELEAFIARFEFGPCKVSDWDAVWMTVQSAALTDLDSQKDFAAQLSFG